jgi:limonene-1,2-epoxide hydrolase
MAERVSDVMGGEESGSMPTQVVERFLDLLRSRDVDGAMELLAMDVEYANAGLPTVHGRARVRRIFRATLGPAGSGFEVYVHAISADGSTVLTERTDVLKFRRLRIQFWVVGRFDVYDGQIVLWRDYADHMTFIAATVRGLIGTVFPAARAKRPAGERAGTDPHNGSPRRAARSPRHRRRH